MLQGLAALKSLIKTKQYHIDFPFFRLHYHATVCLLLAYCLILSAKVFFGDTIDCYSRTAGIKDIYDNICFSTGTYTRYKLASETSKLPSSNITFKVDPNYKYLYSGLFIGDDTAQIFWHHYYPYMPIILFVQAVLFYFPHYLWKIWENGTVSSVCKQLHENRFTPSEYLESNYDLVYYLQNCFRLNRSLVHKYFFCHILLIINLIAQVLALNSLFNYQFLFYGYTVVNFLFDSDLYGIKKVRPQLITSNLNNPMDLVFPKITACAVTFQSSVGKSSDVHDFVCALPLNILNDKFFLLLWLWFLILGCLTLLQIVYDVLYTTLPSFRKYMFSQRYGSFLWDNRRSSLPEMFLLELIGHNTDKYAFSTLLRKLNKEEDWTASPSENQSVV